MDEELLSDFDTFTSAPEEAIAPQEVEAPIVEEVAPQGDNMLSDFDEFVAPKQEVIQQNIPQQVQADPIDQHRPIDLDDDTWMNVKDRVAKFLTVATTIPRQMYDSATEAIDYTQSEIGQAQSVKARLENIDFAYSDLADTLKSATGDEASTNILKTKQKKLNDEVVGILSDRGIEAFNDNGKLKVIHKDKDGNEVLSDLDDDILSNVLGGFTSSAGEIGGALMGATGGAAQAQRVLPPTAPLPLRATAGIVGAGIGGYTGATLGRATDIIRNSISLNKEIDAMDVARKATEAGAMDVAGTAIVGGIAKAGSKAIEPLAKASDRLKTLFKEGDIQGAKRVVREDYGLTDENIDTLFESVKKDVKGFEDLTGDDLLRAKLEAVVQQQPQGKPLITTVIRKNAKAAIEKSKEIDFRAKQVLQSAEQFSKKPSAIRRSIKAYEKVVGSNYGEVRKLIDDALPNYKSDLNLVDFTKTLKDVNTRVIDPLVKDKLTNLTESLSKQKTETIGDLIDARQLFNKFYGKNQSHFESAVDKKSLQSIQKSIDMKIDEAISTLPDEVATGLKSAFKDAKSKYAQMFKTQDTATYNAIFKKGASEDDIGEALVKYSKSTDADLESVLGKLSPAQRVRGEFSILKQMVNKAMPKGEAKAIDFVKLLEDVGTSKASFKTPEAKQFLKNIEGYDRKFGKDIDIQRIASGVAPKIEKNIATSLTGKILMKLSSIRFEAMQRMLPTETGRRLSLLKSIESAMEKSRTPKEFFFTASKIKGIPNKDRIALKEAVKDIGEQEAKLKEELAKQTAKFDKAPKQIEKKDVIIPSYEKPRQVEADEIIDAPIKEDNIIDVEIDTKAIPRKPEVITTEEKVNKRIRNLKETKKSETLFMKGGDQVLVGTIAGVEQDENGKIVIEPEKFLMGVMGVTTLKGFKKFYDKSPKTQFKVKKALRSLAKDSTRVAGDMIEKMNKKFGLDIDKKI